MLPITSCSLTDLAALPQRREAIVADLIERAGPQPAELRIDLAMGRVPVALLGAVPLADRELEKRGSRVRVVGTNPGIRAALRLANLDGLVGGAEEHTAVVGDLPCMLGFGDGVLEVCMGGQALQSARLAAPASSGWMQAIHAHAVLVDLAELPVVNSVLVAWLLQLGQNARPASLELRNVGRQVAIQFNQLRLHHLLKINDS
ncbi:MAG: hypothetical protein H0W72_10020 [Planctomycetes bacterium]|nr:hypothetical protein [Planctomycetota bacterium]